VCPGNVCILSLVQIKLLILKKVLKVSTIVNTSRAMLHEIKVLCFDLNIVTQLFFFIILFVHKTNVTT
jgi:hypothetical protein